MELSYLTGGLAWKADYVAELGADDGTLDLAGWVDADQPEAAPPTPRRGLQLVAGDVNRVRDAATGRLEAAKMMGRVAAAPAPMQEEALFEYHLYTLPRPTTLADHQTKQVALLAAQGVPVKKELLLSGADHYYRSSAGDIGQKLKTAVYVEFANRDAAGLGLPLPKGVVRVYKRDAAGNAQFVGEDRVDHTPKNENRAPAPGRRLRRHRRQAPDRLPPPRTQQQGQLCQRERLRDHAAQRQAAGRHRDRARAGAR